MRAIISWKVLYRVVYEVQIVLNNKVVDNECALLGLWVLNE